MSAYDKIPLKKSARQILLRQPDMSESGSVQPCVKVPSGQYGLEGNFATSRQAGFFNTIDKFSDLQRRRVQFEKQTFPHMALIRRFG